VGERIRISQWPILLISNSDSILEELDSTLTSNQLRVVVPSRCYSVKSKEKPLAGARIVVKDNFDIEGFKTSICSKAWLEYQQPANKTAACIQRLLDQGAILLGKAKLQAWIMREEPLECVDFLAPFNPRGDGYQTASGSSNGSGAAMGSYAWLDFSVGSDSMCDQV
jgi:Asp-tRNA(Asn)/Glu-tRNA(Gln) amidotransferase A subunit family amidase